MRKILVQFCQKSDKISRIHLQSLGSERNQLCLKELGRHSSYERRTPGRSEGETNFRRGSSVLCQDASRFPKDLKEAPRQGLPAKLSASCLL